MAEQSGFWTTSGVGDGPGGGYSMQRLYDFFRKMFIGDQEATEGVLLREANALLVQGAASPLTVKSGSAIVHGFFYENSSDLSLAVSTPAATTGGHVILRANWTAQTVRAFAVLNTSGVTDPPALTQTAGVTWEIRLATFTITNAGVITLTDARAYAQYSSEIATVMINNDAIDDTKLRNSAALSVIGRASNSTGNPADIAAASDAQVLRRAGTALGFGTVVTAGIADLAVTSGKLADGAVVEDKIGAVAVTTAKIGTSQVTTAKIADGNVTEDKLGTGAATVNKIGALAVTSAKLAADSVIAGKIADGAVDVTASLANDIVDDTKVGNRVPQFYRRQGGSATDWSTPGVTDRTPGAVRMQGGVFAISADDSEIVTFPIAFSYPPLLLLSESSAVPQHSWILSSISASAFAVSNPDAVYAIELNWLAIGPE